MSGIGVEALFVFLLIIANGVFALSEIAIVSARKARLQQWAENGDARARTALALAQSPGDFLAAVQIGITLVGIMTGAFGGATIAEALAKKLETIPALAPYHESLALGLVILVTTYLSLVIGELAPKRLGLNSPERIAVAVAGPMQRLSRITAPAVRLLSASTELLLRGLGMRASTEPPITEAEINVLVEQGTAAGVFEEAEEAMVARVLRLGDLRASALMIPRQEMIWLDTNDAPAEIQRKISASPLSFFPVCQDQLDNVVGVVQARELLVRCLAGEPVDLKASAQSPLFVYESIRALKLLEQFKQTGQHIAVVIDEYGGTLGVVSPDDILQAIVGDLPAVGELAQPQVVQREDGSWLIDGMLRMHEIRELFEIAKLPEEEEGDYETLGGFIMTYLKRIPTIGDHFDWDGFRFEVMDMDGRRVDQVLVSPLGGEEQH